LTPAGIPRDNVIGRPKPNALGLAENYTKLGRSPASIKPADHGNLDRFEVISVSQSALLAGFSHLQAGHHPM
jgi:hypothetical protein